MLDELLENVNIDLEKELCVLCGEKGHFRKDCKYYEIYMKDYPKFKYKWSKEEYFKRTLKKWIRKKD